MKSDIKTGKNFEFAIEAGVEWGRGEGLGIDEGGLEVARMKGLGLRLEESCVGGKSAASAISYVCSPLTLSQN